MLHAQTIGLPRSDCRYLHDVLVSIEKSENTAVLSGEQIKNNSLLKKIVFIINFFLIFFIFFSLKSPVEIYADVIQGSLHVISNGGNGFRGQDGGRGAHAPDSTARVKYQSNTIQWIAFDCIR